MSNILAGKKLIDEVIKYAFEKKAENVTVIDVRGLSAPCEYFVTMTADSIPHLKAVSENIDSGIRRRSEPATRPSHIEGVRVSEWVVIDYFDVIVHIMTPRQKAYYDIEGRWDAGKITTVQDVLEIKPTKEVVKKVAKKTVKKAVKKVAKKAVEKVAKKVVKKAVKKVAKKAVKKTVKKAVKKVVKKVAKKAVKKTVKKK